MSMRMTRSATYTMACALALAPALAMATAHGQAVPAPDSLSAPARATVSGATVSVPSAQDRNKNNDDGLIIEPQDLPATYPHALYRVIFHARGNYVPVLHWSVSQGALPPGITLDDGGAFQGEAQRTGEFEFVVVVRDGGKPQQAVQRAFTIKVSDAFSVKWGSPAHVNSNRIEGSVQVTNASNDDLDLTFDVKAVNEYGRATEIGYQHFPLKKGTIEMSLPFGENLPYGTYTVYVDVNAEVAARNAIYKQELQAPHPLQVLVGP